MMHIYIEQVDLIIKIHVDISPTLTSTMLLKFVRLEDKKSFTTCRSVKIYCFPMSLWLALIDI